MTCLKFWVGGFLEGATGAAPLRMVAVLAGLLVLGEAKAQQLVGGVIDRAVEAHRGGVDLKLSYQLLAVTERRVVQAKPGVALLADASPNSRLQRATLASAASKREAEVLAQGSPQLGLEDLVGLAIQAHPEIVAKRADLDAARAGQDAARWQYFPTPSLQLRQQGSGSNVTVAAVQLKR